MTTLVELGHQQQQRLVIEPDLTEIPQLLDDWEWEEEWLWKCNNCCNNFHCTTPLPSNHQLNLYNLEQMTLTIFTKNSLNIFNMSFVLGSGTISRNQHGSREDLQSGESRDSRISTAVNSQSSSVYDNVKVFMKFESMTLTTFCQKLTSVLFRIFFYKCHIASLQLSLQRRLQPLLEKMFRGFWTCFWGLWPPKMKI